MSRPFHASFDSTATVEAVFSAFRDEDYWRARLTALGGSRTLDSLDVGADGAVRVATSEDLLHSALPGILTTLYRGDLTVRSEERWTPTSRGCVSGTISVAVSGAPGSGRGAATLSPSEGGSRLELSGTLEFKVPIVGGRVEKYVAAQFVEGLSHVQCFTTRWIGEHG